MTPPPAPERLEAAYQTALAALLAERTPEGHWVGELSTSALSTATAISALALVQKHGSPRHLLDGLILGGVQWLVRHQNADGGWGDTARSISNISTSMLCRAAFHLTGIKRAKWCAASLLRVEAYLEQQCGATPEQQAEAIRARYGKDRTFSVPILMTSALAGLVPWTEVPPLPFELACFPQSWFRFLRLHVVSYALPALIAIGQTIYHHRPPRNPITRWTRRLAIRKSLRVLEAIQPSSGGFLEATPLTSFVTMALASSGRAEHPVAQRAVEFLVNSVRPDDNCSSWPIDTNLATWVTTLSVNALAAAGDLASLDRKDEMLTWLLGQQYLKRHPYTGAAPGGWAWTDLPGGVPDCDDTPGALLAISHLAGPDTAATIDALARRVYGPVKMADLEHAPALSERQEDLGRPAYHAFCGLEWVRSLQNRDGGWPTFCRGWGHLPFDRSGSDLTAHALRAIRVWIQRSVATRVLGVLNEAVDFGASIPTPGTFRRVTERGFAYLAREQHPDGSWLPLWFGNQFAPNDENPTYGTARVLAVYRDLDRMDEEPARRGVAWLLSVQNADGGWGGAAGVHSSMEETALAVEVLLDQPGADTPGSPLQMAVNSGLAWLVQQVERGGLHEPTPIGFYFAKLWYFEKLYPIIFTVAALGRARRKPSHRDDARLT